MSFSPTGVLFVCLGNICRSPLAEGVFLHLASSHGVLDRFDVDSCGTGAWHVGKCPDARSLAVATAHGIVLPSTARQVDAATDFDRFGWIIAMDESNRADLLGLGAPCSSVHLLRSFCPRPDSAPGSRSLEVPDPYHGGPDGFQSMYTMVSSACEGLLARLLQGCAGHP